MKSLRTQLEQINNRMAVDGQQPAVRRNSHQQALARMMRMLGFTMVPFHEGLHRKTGHLWVDRFLIFTVQPNLRIDSYTKLMYWLSGKSDFNETKPLSESR